MSDRHPPTEEQRRAVEHPLTDACVTASAGSGKTSVLTGRFHRLVRAHGFAVRRIAALTFTEKAASQMRERIARLFEEAGDEAARDAVEFASISTIHACCARWLRLHPVEAGVDPAFEVLDEEEGSLLREDSAVAALRRLHAEAPDVHAVLASLRAGPGVLTALLERVWGAGLSARDLRWAPGRCTVAAAVAAVLQGTADLRDGEAVDGGKWRDAVRTAAHDANAAAADPSLAAEAKESVAALRVGTGKATGPLRAARDALETALDDLDGAFLDEFAQREVAPALVRTLVAVEEAYEAGKRERSALDFTDLERYAVLLLDRLAAQGRTVEPSPAAVLVDEFQDTNPLQARILDRLRAPGRPRFSVGDPKQSIYRFRRADVTVLTREWERVGDAGRHHLGATFRAHPAIVAALNGLHERLFAGDRAGVPFAPMRPEGDFRATESPAVELTLVDVGNDANVAAGRAAEAAWIAARVREAVEAGTPRMKGKPGRTLGYGDVALLLRARTDVAIYERALAAEGIRYHTHRGHGYWQAEEIADLVMVLRVIHNPEDRFAVACLATGPVMAAGDDDLLRWFREGGRPFERIAGEAGETGRFRRQVDALLDLRREAVAGRLEVVVEGVLHRLGLLAAARLQPDGERRAANLRKTVLVARRLARRGRHGLGDLLRHLGMVVDRDVREAEAPMGGEGEDVVRIHSVHGAKGLEFPWVILADVGRKGRNQTAAFLEDGAGGFAARLVDPLEGVERKPGGYSRLAAIEAAREREESLRLLYVATTRAEERLWITGCCTGWTKEGQPKGHEHWGRDLLDALGLRGPLRGEQDVRVGEGTVRVRVVLPAQKPSPATRALVAPKEGPTFEDGVDLAPLGGTRYVVTVSELLAFAESPQSHYRDRVFPRGVERTLPEIPRDPEEPDDGLFADPEAGRREERRASWDEGPEEGALDRAALGRAVHSVIERLTSERVEEDSVVRAVAQEWDGTPPPLAAPAVAAMASRFVASDTGARFLSGLRSGAPVAREIAFHARVRFPAGATVGPFDALLVKGSIDLWLPEGEGVAIVDHKTNPPGARFATPEALRDHYSWQLRLYALAAERVLGTPVTGARLLLLDPGWGPRAIEVPVDVSGPALEEARHLCRAFAIAEMEGRWPASWRTLLAQAPPPA